MNHLHLIHQDLLLFHYHLDRDWETMVEQVLIVIHTMVVEEVEQQLLEQMQQLQPQDRVETVRQ